MAGNVWRDQYNAAGIEGFNYWKHQSISKQIEQVIEDQLQSINQQNTNFETALSHMLKMKDFLSMPQHILGNERTKHGEVAENLEVNVRNAFAALKGKDEVATFEGVGRTAPEDFILEGIKYQSKFINGTNNTLKHIHEHFNKYQDTTMNYSIPKDQYQIIEAIRLGNYPDDLNEKSIRAILQRVKEIELSSGRAFQDIVTPSISNYSEVQLGEVGETVLNFQDQITDENQNRLNQIERESQEKTNILNANKGPSVAEGLKIAGIGAAISASLNTVTIIYKKTKEGKKLQDFNKNDWTEIGLSSIKVGGQSFVAAGSIYSLTHLTSLSAPFAGAVTSAAMGLSSLLTDLTSNKIAIDEFVTQGQILCIEAGIAAIGGAIGQILIPVPVLGAIIGTVTTNVFWGFAKDKLGEREKELKGILDSYTSSILAQVDKTYYDIIANINSKYARYDSLIEAAFDVNANAAVLAAVSVDLAIELGVEQSKILKSDEDLDEYFLG